MNKLVNYLLNTCEEVEGDVKKVIRSLDAVCNIDSIVMVFGKFCVKICTGFLSGFDLRNSGFGGFARRTTNTTTLLIKERKYN